MTEEKHGAVVGMVVLNAESKIYLMMLTWSTMRITKRWPLMDLIHNIATLVGPLSSTNKLKNFKSIISNFMSKKSSLDE